MIGHYDLAEMLHNVSYHEHKSRRGESFSFAESAAQGERAAGKQMSDNIDSLIRAASMSDSGNGSSSSGSSGRHKQYINMYWHGGRVPSAARDLYRETVLVGEAGQPLRPFSFSDCGDKPRVLRFEVGLMCSQNGRQVGRCCVDRSCQDRFMSAPYPAAIGVTNF